MMRMLIMPITVREHRADEPNIRLIIVVLGNLSARFLRLVYIRGAALFLAKSGAASSTTSFGNIRSCSASNGKWVR